MNKHKNKIYHPIHLVIMALGIFILLRGLFNYLETLIPGIDSSAPEIVAQEQKEAFLAQLSIIGGIFIILADYIWVRITCRYKTD